MHAHLIYTNGKISSRCLQWFIIIMGARSEHRITSTIRACENEPFSEGFFCAFQNRHVSYYYDILIIFEGILSFLVFCISSSTNWYFNFIKNRKGIQFGNWERSHFPVLCGYHKFPLTIYCCLAYFSLQEKVADTQKQSNCKKNQRALKFEELHAKKYSLESRLIPIYFIRGLICVPYKYAQKECSKNIEAYTEIRSSSTKNLSKI